MDIELEIDLLRQDLEANKRDSESESENRLTPVEDILSDELLTFIEVKFWVYGEIPKEDELLVQFPSEGRRVLELLVDPDFNMKLVNRGLPQITIRPSSTGFNPLAVVAANLVSDFADKRSLAAKLKQVGISTRQWHGFLKNKKFKAYFEGLCAERFDGVSPIADISLAKLVETGDLKAIQYFNEMSGRYRPQNEETLHLTMIIARMMEILAKYVDVSVLGQIAAEIDTVIEVGEVKKELNA